MLLTAFRRRVALSGAHLRFKCCHHFRSFVFGQIRALGLNLRALGFPINRGLNVCRLRSSAWACFILRLKGSHNLGGLGGDLEVRALGLDLRALGLPNRIAGAAWVPSPAAALAFEAAS